MNAPSERSGTGFLAVLYDVVFRQLAIVLSFLFESKLEKTV